MRVVETQLASIHWDYGVKYDSVLTVGFALHRSQGIQKSTYVQHTKHIEGKYNLRVYEGN